ncbi:alpha/beta hydrolase [Candidatus Kapaibacterium sp.]
MAFFNFEGNQVYYDVYGEGEPLLLLHGNSVSSTLFESCKVFFSKYFKVIIMDYPGHGKSGRFERFRDDFWRYNGVVALDLMSYLKIEKFNIIGTSGGAMAGLNMAILQPERIKKIIADSFFGDSITYSEALDLVTRRRAAKNDFMTVQYWKYHNGDDWENVVDNDCNMMLSFTEKGLPTIHGNPSEITADVLLVATSTDELLPDILGRLDKFAAKLNSVEKKYYNFGRHTFMITEKEEFRKIALEFLLR